MATPVALAIRREEAEKKIAAYVQQLAEKRGLDMQGVFTLSHRDAQILALMKVEAVADALGKIVDREPLAQARGASALGAVPDASAKSLRQAIQEASDDDLVAMPGIGLKSIEALRTWAATEPQQAQDEAQEDKALEPPITIETKLEAETGSNPPTYVEIDEKTGDVRVDLDAIPPDVDHVNLPGGSTLERDKTATAETVEVVPTEEAPDALSE